MDTVAVDLTGLQIGNEEVPIVIGTVLGGVEREDLRRDCAVDLVEEQQLDYGGLVGKDAEVDAARRTAWRPKEMQPLALVAS